MENIPAFPHTEVGCHGDTLMEHNGMTLRDYFAAAALQGCLSNNENYSLHAKEAGEPCVSSYIARACYMQADAMLKARES
jgi:hypothetical protein